MWRRVLLAAGLLLSLPLLVLVAFGLAMGLGTPPPPEAPALAGRTFAGALEHEGRRRSWLLYVPQRLASPAPLVLVLPGSGQRAEHMRQLTGYRFEELAERDGALVAYAEAWERGGAFGLSPEWNECRKNTDLPAHRENVDDVGFLLRVVGEIAREHPVDARRLYAAGLSDGGQMSYRLATEHPERFAAVAIVVAQQAAPENSNCLSPRGPISVLVMNGSADPIIPFGGGEASFYGFLSAGQVQAMDATLAHWRRVNGLSGAPETVALPDRDPNDGSRVERVTWRDGEREVVGYRVLGGGHAFPGGWQYAPEWLVGRTNRDLLAADEIWEFFWRHALAAE